MQSFIELLKDHSLILAASASLRAIVEQDEPAPERAFDALRRLSRQLEAHLRAEADFLDLDREPQRREFAALADEHGQRFDDLVRDWSVYLREWSEENIAEDWQTFAANTRHILGRLTAQVDAENGSIYPAALKYGLIRLVPERAE